MHVKPTNLHEYQLESAQGPSQLPQAASTNTDLFRFWSSMITPPLSICAKFFYLVHTDFQSFLYPHHFDVGSYHFI